MTIIVNKIIQQNLITLYHNTVGINIDKLTEMIVRKKSSPSDAVGLQTAAPLFLMMPPVR